MFDPFAAAQAVLNRAFTDREPLLYVCAGQVPVSVAAIRSEFELLDGGRRIVYEVAYSAGLPATPSKRDTFVHRGRTWGVSDWKPHDDVGAWELTVLDQGAAA